MATSRVRPSSPGPGRIDFGDLGTTEPIGRAFGGDRGTPIDRHYIEGFLDRHRRAIRGTVLEIGEDAYTRRFGAASVRAEILDAPGSDNPSATYRVDLQTGEGLPRARFDCVVITQTLHMIYDVRGVVRSLHAALKPGGTVLATVPGISQIDVSDGPEKWFWMMTQSAARRLFGEVFRPEDVAVEVHGNVLAATAFLQGIAREELDRASLDVVDPLYPVISGIVARKAGRAR